MAETVISIPVPIFLIGLLAVLLLLGLIVLIARRRGRIDIGDAFGLISRRLETIQELSQDLSHIFKAPQSRGMAGEVLLERLLADQLPRRFWELQYSFRGGTRVDAIVRLGKRFVPVDSKFPLPKVSEAGVSGETKKATLQHIRDISRRYIHPEEGSFPFAMMYIPSEAIYYRVFVEQSDTNLLTEALRQHVVPVSPSGLFLYLQTVAYGLKGWILSENQERLLALIEELQGEFAEFSRVFTTLGTHTKNLTGSYEEASSLFGRLDLRVQRLKMPEDGL